MSDTSIPVHDITAIILAGGRATRLGGIDKGLVALDGRPLIEHVLDRLRPEVSTVIINANRNRDIYAGYGCAVVTDATDDFPGPLAGILAGLRAARTPDVLIVPVDMPRLPMDLTHRLCAARGDRPVACVHDGERLQPLCALLSRDVTAGLADFIAADGRKVHDWIQTLSPVIVDFADQAPAFVNLNTPEAFADFAGATVTGAQQAS